MCIYLCCLAQARAKFKYALEKRKDKEAKYFIRNIGRLYYLEEQYRLRHLTPEQIMLSFFYHTFIETGKMCSVSTFEYSKEFFNEIMRLRTNERIKVRVKLAWTLPCKEKYYSIDYENMLPMTIGVEIQKLKLVLALQVIKATPKSCFYA